MIESSHLHIFGLEKPFLHSNFFLKFVPLSHFISRTCLKFYSFSLLLIIKVGICEILFVSFDSKKSYTEKHEGGGSSNPLGPVRVKLVLPSTTISARRPCKKRTNSTNTSIS